MSEGFDRRAFLKAMFAFGVGAAKSAPKSSELTKASLIFPEYVASQQIWQVVIQSGQGVVEAIEAGTPLRAGQHGFAINLISSDFQSAVNFTGPKGGGVHALIGLDSLFAQGRLSDRPEIAKYNPRLAKVGDNLVVGKTEIVAGNFAKLLDTRMAGLSEYCVVSHSWEIDKFVLSVDIRSKPDPVVNNWQDTNVVTFTRSGTSAPWERS